MSSHLCSAYQILLQPMEALNLIKGHVWPVVTAGLNSGHWHSWLHSSHIWWLSDHSSSQRSGFDNAIHSSLQHWLPPSGPFVLERCKLIFWSQATLVLWIVLEQAPNLLGLGVTYCTCTHNYGILRGRPRSYNMLQPLYVHIHTDLHCFSSIWALFLRFRLLVDGLSLLVLRQMLLG